MLRSSPALRHQFARRSSRGHQAAFQAALGLSERPLTFSCRTFFAHLKVRPSASILVNRSVSRERDQAIVPRPFDAQGRENKSAGLEAVNCPVHAAGHPLLLTLFRSRHQVNERQRAQQAQRQGQKARSVARCTTKLTSDFKAQACFTNAIALTVASSGFAVRILM